MNKNISLFPITVEPQEEGGFLATCSTLQGCHAEGQTYGEAIENIQDVIKIHIKARKEHNEPIPSVSMPEKTNLRLSLPLPVAI